MEEFIIDFDKYEWTNGDEPGRCWSKNIDGFQEIEQEEERHPHPWAHKVYLKWKNYHWAGNPILPELSALREKNWRNGAFMIHYILNYQILYWWRLAF